MPPFQIVELKAMAMRGLEHCSSGTSSDSIEFFDAIADPGQPVAEPQDAPQVNGHVMAGETSDSHNASKSRFLKQLSAPDDGTATAIRCIL